VKYYVFQDLASLRANFQRREQQIRATADRTIQKNKTFIFEMETFFNFYNKLDPKVNRNTLILTAEQEELFDESDKFHQAMAKFYRKKNKKNRRFY